MTVAYVALKVTLSFVEVVSKLDPLMVTVAPGSTTPGEKLVIAGVAEPTVKTAALVDVPPGAVTLIVPVVAPAGTVATICVVVLELTVARTPLNLTVFCEGVALKPVP